MSYNMTGVIPVISTTEALVDVPFEHPPAPVSTEHIPSASTPAMRVPSSDPVSADRPPSASAGPSRKQNGRRKTTKLVSATRDETVPTDKEKWALLRFGSGPFARFGSRNRSRLFEAISGESDDDPPMLCAFVNVSSGGNDGAVVMDILQKVLGVDVVFDLKKDRGPEKGLELVANDQRREVRALVAGGDGTFSWVANAVDQQELRNVRLVVVPLGTGNDMSRALGWGRKTPPVSRIPHFVQWAKRADSRTLDVWRLEAIHAPGRMEAGESTDSDGISHGARPLVCNYLSLGADAHVELQFSLLRWDSPDKYKSRIGNLRAHVIAGAKYVTTEKKINVSNHLESLVVDGRKVDLPKNLQALIFCNIPSYGAGTQPWGEPSKRSSSRPTFVNDGRFEVIGLKSLHHFNRMKVDPTAHGMRICQGSSMELVLKSERTPFQVDGEPWVQLGGTVTLKPGNAVGVLPGPFFNHASRKNATFFEGENGESGEFANVQVNLSDTSVDDTQVRSPHGDEGGQVMDLGPELGSVRPPESFG